MSRLSFLVQQAHSIVQPHLKTGDVAIDGTCGNGYDSLFLAQQVASCGLVYSFDIQFKAIHVTEQRLAALNLLGVVKLIQTDHAEMIEHIAIEHHGKVKAAMFNLGYLPNTDKAVITQAHSTLIALNQTIQLLAPQGIITIVAYPGHAGGETETEQVQNWCQQLPITQFHFKVIHNPHHHPAAPRLFVVRKYF